MASSEALKKKSNSPRKVRLTKEAWLAKALTLIKEEGPSCLGLRYMTDKLGVTTGSFYWHFDSLENFIDEIMKYWYQEYSLKASELTNMVSAVSSPRERLSSLTAVILSNEAGRYDLGIRAWAATNSHVASYVEKVDKFRLEIVEEIFKALGFVGVELQIRIENYLSYVSFYKSINIAINAQEYSLEERLPNLIDYFIGKE